LAGICEFGETDYVPSVPGFPRVSECCVVVDDLYLNHAVTELIVECMWV